MKKIFLLLFLTVASYSATPNCCSTSQSYLPVGKPALRSPTNTAYVNNGDDLEARKLVYLTASPNTSFCSGQNLFIEEIRFIETATNTSYTTYTVEKWVSVASCGPKKTCPVGQTLNEDALLNPVCVCPSGQTMDASGTCVSECTETIIEPLPELPIYQTSYKTWSSSDSSGGINTSECLELNGTIQSARHLCDTTYRCVLGLHYQPCTDNSTWDIALETCKCNKDFIPEYSPSLLTSTLISCSKPECPTLSPKMSLPLKVQNVTDDQCRYFKNDLFGYTYEFLTTPTGLVTCCYTDSPRETPEQEVCPINYVEDENGTCIPLDNPLTNPFAPEDNSTNPNGGDGGGDGEGNETIECPTGYVWNGFTQKCALLIPEGGDNGLPGAGEEEQESNTSQEYEPFDRNGTIKSELNQLFSMGRELLVDFEVSRIVPDMQCQGGMTPIFAVIMGHTYTLFNPTWITPEIYSTMQNVFKWIAIVSALIIVFSTI